MRAIAMLVGVLSCSCAAQAGMERCLIEVGDRSYLSGRCNVERQPDGSLLVGIAAKASPFFASSCRTG